MRKVLNILESCSLSYKSIESRKVYDVTGRPSDDDMLEIYKGLTSLSFQNAFIQIMKLKLEKSLSVDDIIREVHVLLMKTEIPDGMKMFIVNRLSEIEYRLAQGSNEKAQVAALVGAFIEARTIKG